MKFQMKIVNERFLITLLRGGHWLALLFEGWSKNIDRKLELLRISPEHFRLLLSFIPLAGLSTASDAYY